MNTKIDLRTRSVIKRAMIPFTGGNIHSIELPSIEWINRFNFDQVKMGKISRNNILTNYKLN